MAVELNLLASNSVNNIDSNFQRVAAALQEVISRNGIAPNEMNADLDLNSNDILNVATLDVDALTIGGVNILDNADITAVAGIVTEIETVASISGDVITVAGIASDVTTVADNIADINNFSDIWLGAKSTEPTVRNDGSPLQAGDMYFDLVMNEPRWYSGGVWVSISEQGLQLASKSFVGDGVTTAFTLDVTPASANNILVWVGGVRQRPETDYTVSGLTLTITPAPGSAISIDTLVLAKSTEILVPADGSVTNSKLANDSVNAAKIDGTDAAAIRSELNVPSIPVSVANGGTGATDAVTARDNLGVEIGVDVQAFDAQLATVAGLTGVNGSLIRWTGASSAIMQLIEGVVSKSGSTVTGAIYETGSNANGYFIKFGNGVMVQWNEISATPDDWTTAIGSFFRPAAAYQVTFPQPFSATSSMFILGQMRRAGTGYVGGTNILTFTTTTADILPWTNVSLAASASKLFGYIAIGHWG